MIAISLHCAAYAAAGLSGRDGLDQRRDSKGARKLKNGQRKNAQTAATVLSVNAKTSCIYNYTTTAIERQVPDFEVLDGGCQGVRPRMVGIGFALLLLTAGLTDNGTLPLWGTVLAGMVGMALLMGGVRNA